jgi:Xaa-Pro aminopeptidase
MTQVTTQAEVERRYRTVREAAAADGLDAVVVSGSEYTGFEGAVRYLSGFRILHRYAYVVLPVEGEPAIVFPREARWVGDHSESWIEDRVFAEHPGAWIAERASGWRRVGVYGLDYVMAVRDYRALADGPAEIVGWDQGFDLARAVKSAEELELVRESFRINEDGFRAVLAAYEVGKTEAELMAEAERVFTAAGTYRTTMDMVLTGTAGGAGPEFKFPALRRIGHDDLVLYGLEVAGPGGHWVEFSRPICAGQPNRETLSAMDAYLEYFEEAKRTMRAGATAHDVHTAVSKGFLERGFTLGHVTGHSIGMTMIESPRVGEGIEVELRENMVVSMHPHAITADERTCLYMQDTWLVTKDGGAPFSQIPLKIFNGTEHP